MENLAGHEIAHLNYRYSRFAMEVVEIDNLVAVVLVATTLLWYTLQMRLCKFHPSPDSSLDPNFRHTPNEIQPSIGL